VAHAETSRAFLDVEDLCRAMHALVTRPPPTPSQLRLVVSPSAAEPPSGMTRTPWPPLREEPYERMVAASAFNTPPTTAEAAASPATTNGGGLEVYHLASFNTNVAGLAAAIAARTGARIVAVDVRRPLLRSPIPRPAADQHAPDQLIYSPDHQQIDLPLICSYSRVRSRRATPTHVPRSSTTATTSLASRWTRRASRAPTPASRTRGASRASWRG